MRSGLQSGVALRTLATRGRKREGPTPQGVGGMERSGRSEGQYPLAVPLFEHTAPPWRGDEGNGRDRRAMLLAGTHQPATHEQTRKKEDDLQVNGLVSHPLGLSLPGRKANLPAPEVLHDIQEGQPAGSQEPYKGSRG